MILFRADGNSSVGMGHVMRCLSIADGFRNIGENCLFVTADEGLHTIIEERGYENKVLNTRHDRMEEELIRLEEIINSEKIDMVFVDSYFVTDHYLRELRGFCGNRGILLIYLDDVLAFPYPCDVLINYNIFASREAYEMLYANTMNSHKAVPEFLIGTDYAPQRAEFQGLPDREVRQTGRDILISTGGADAEHMGLELMKCIMAHGEWKDYGFHFVIGAMNADKQEICSLAEGQKNIRLYQGVRRMSELMQSCDIAISAAGSTLYELCSTQTPTLTYILADNQIPSAEGFEKKQILKCIGDVRDLGAKKLAEELLRESVMLLEDATRRRAIAEKMKTVIDGEGAKRIAKEVMELAERIDKLK